MVEHRPTPEECRYHVQRRDDQQLVAFTNDTKLAWALAYDLVGRRSKVEVVDTKRHVRLQGGNQLVHGIW